MFTGIIEETGKIKSVNFRSDCGTLEIEADKTLSDVHIGDSIAVNGVCLTVTSFTRSSFTADVMAETVRRSSLGFLKKDSFVNLERAMAANGRFGGHIVSGHIDGLGTITGIKNEGNAIWLEISASPALLRYIVKKGSIAIDGVSLTVATTESDAFKVSIIPHTSQETTLTSKNTGDRVNLETDIIAKYIEKLINPAAKETKSSNIDMDFLKKCGF